MGSAIDLLELALVPRKRKRAVVYDIDGTLTSAVHRVNLLDQSPRDWSTFHGGMTVDAPIERTIYQLRKEKEEGLAVVLLTLRPDRYRQETEDWLAQHDVPYDELYLRPEGTQGIRGNQMKEIIYQKDIAPRFKVERAYDDHQPNLDMWRRVGVPSVKVFDPAIDPLPGRPASDPKYPFNKPSKAYVSPHMRIGPGGMRYTVKGHWRRLRRAPNVPMI